MLQDLVCRNPKTHHIMSVIRTATWTFLFASYVHVEKTFPRTNFGSSSPGRRNMYM